MELTKEEKYKIYLQEKERMEQLLLDEERITLFD
ncbi:hypothetical protein ABID52_002223 [Fictibacillus halophilus]|uniref:Uncharacterized protein n=1 Tax=Fictibacillus halophilus TaxID=1610490 RepID=A0ABV2LMB1_9BACL